MRDELLETCLDAVRYEIDLLLDRVIGEEDIPTCMEANEKLPSGATLNVVFDTDFGWSAVILGRRCEYPNIDEWLTAECEKAFDWDDVIEEAERIIGYRLADARATQDTYDSMAGWFYAPIN